MSVSRRALLMFLLATASCEAGPTSEWPGQEDDKDDDDESTSRPDGGASVMDAAVKGDAGRTPNEDCAAGDAGDAGADASCASRDF